MAIFLDTGFFFFFVDPNDTNNNRCVELLPTIQSGIYGQIFTSTYVISETLILTALRTKNNSIILKKVINFLKGEDKIAIIYQSSEINEQKSIDLFLKVNADSSYKPYSFVDCSNIIFCKEHLI